MVSRVSVWALLLVGFLVMGMSFAFSACKTQELYQCQIDSGFTKIENFTGPDAVKLACRAFLRMKACADPLLPNCAANEAHLQELISTFSVPVQCQNQYDEHNNGTAFQPKQTSLLFALAVAVLMTYGNRLRQLC